MKRDQRLHGLSSEHHHALVLALRIHKAHEAGSVDQVLANDVIHAYVTELRPHFEVEEALLLPALKDAGAAKLAERTLSEHQALAALLERIRAGDVEALESFGALLKAHVRFEERELFPACEALLDAAVLDAVALRSPKPSQG